MLNAEATEIAEFAEKIFNLTPTSDYLGFTSK